MCTGFTGYEGRKPARTISVCSQYSGCREREAPCGTRNPTLFLLGLPSYAASSRAGIHFSCGSASDFWADSPYIGSEKTGAAKGRMPNEGSVSQGTRCSYCVDRRECLRPVQRKAANSLHGCQSGRRGSADLAKRPNRNV